MKVKWVDFPNRSHKIIISLHQPHHLSLVYLPHPSPIPPPPSSSVPLRFRSRWCRASSRRRDGVTRWWSPPNPNSSSLAAGTAPGASTISTCLIAVRNERREDTQNNPHCQLPLHQSLQNLLFPELIRLGSLSVMNDFYVYQFPDTFEFSLICTCLFQPSLVFFPHCFCSCLLAGWQRRCRGLGWRARVAPPSHVRTTPAASSAPNS